MDGINISTNRPRAWSNVDIDNEVVMYALYVNNKASNKIISLHGEAIITYVGLKSDYHGNAHASMAENGEMMEAMTRSNCGLHGR